MTIYEEIRHLAFNNGEFIIGTDKRKITSKIVIIASGTKPKRLKNLEKEGIGNKIFYEVCPIYEAKNKRIAIIGAGDIAFDYALTLPKKNNVLIINRSEKPRCLPLLLERAPKKEEYFLFYKYNRGGCTNSRQTHHYYSQ